MAAVDKEADLEAIVGALALPADVAIRAWVEADFPTIQQLSQAEGWSTPITRPDDALEAWRRSWPALVAVTDEAVIGFCRALSDGLVTTYIAELLIAPAWRRRGIASALLEATQRLMSRFATGSALNGRCRRVLSARKLPVTCGLSAELGGTRGGSAITPNTEARLRRVDKRLPSNKEPRLLPAALSV